jgi:hypothetical protein
MKQPASQPPAATGTRRAHASTSSAHLADGGVHAVLHAEHLDGRALLLQPLKQRALHLDLRAVAVGMNGAASGSGGGGEG